MSLLDTIKSLFCPKKSVDSEPEKTINVKKSSEENVAVPSKSEIQKTSEEVVSTPEEEPVVAASMPISEPLDTITIPQDSTLKRHYLSALKTKIEAEMGDYPTDSALKRQYDSTVQTKLDQLLG